MQHTNPDRPESRALEIGPETLRNNISRSLGGVDPWYLLHSWQSRFSWS